MKIYVRASLKSFSESLKDLLVSLESGELEEFPDNGEFTFVINKEHKYIDVFKNNKLYAQVYTNYQRHSKPYEVSEIKYVGEGNGNYILKEVGQGKGDYIKKKRTTARPLYDADDFYIDYIDFTSR